MRSCVSAGPFWRRYSSTIIAQGCDRSLDQSAQSRPALGGHSHLFLEGRRCSLASRYSLARLHHLDCLPWYSTGILVLGIIDAFVHAHNHLCRNGNNPGNFEDCMQERVRLLTALAPAYAHALQKVCLGRRARVAFQFETSDSLLPRPCIIAYPMFVQRRA